jgi:hypothetical protein
LNGMVKGRKRVGYLISIRRAHGVKRSAEFGRPRNSFESKRTQLYRWNSLYTLHARYHQGFRVDRCVSTIS